MLFLSKVCEKRSRRRADAESCTANVAESAREHETLQKKKKSIPSSHMMFRCWQEDKQHQDTAAALQQCFSGLKTLPHEDEGKEGFTSGDCKCACTMEDSMVGGASGRYLPRVLKGL